MSQRTLYVGLDIRDDITQIAVLEPSKEGPDILMAGGEGGGQTMNIKTEVEIPGSGLRVQGFLEKIYRQETIYADGRKSNPVNILAAFLRRTLSLTKKKYPSESIRMLVVTTEYRELSFITTVYKALEKLGIGKDRALVADRGQSYVYYVMSQKKELWVNQVGMFDFRDSRITYYQMQADRLKRPAIVKVTEKDYSDYAQLFISGEQTDEEKSSIFEGMVHGAIHGQIITSLYMTGAGFENDFAADVMKKLSVGRHLFKGDNLYVCGACYMARELGGERRLDDVVYLGEDIVTSDLTIQVYADAQERELPLVRAGTAWYHIEKEMDLIPDGDQELAVCIKNVVTKKQSVRLIPMDGILGRTDRRARVGIQIRFSGPDRCIMTLRDKGFGEFFPSSYRIWEETITL